MRSCLSRTPASFEQSERIDQMAAISLSSVAAYVFVGKTASVAGVLAPEMQKAGARTFIFITESTGPNAALANIVQNLQAAEATVLLYTDGLSQVDRLKTVVGLWTTEGRRIGGVIYDQTDAVPDDLGDVLYHAAGMQNLHQSTATLQLDFFLVYHEKDTPAAAMAKRLARHRSRFGLPLTSLELECRPWVADAVETQILTGFRSVFPDPAQAEGRNQHPKPGTGSVYSSSSGDGTAQTEPTTPGGSNAYWSSPLPANSPLEECDPNFVQALAAGTDHSPIKVNTGSLFLFDIAAEQIASLLAVEADEIDLDAPVAALGVDSLIATAFCNWLETEAKVYQSIEPNVSFEDISPGAWSR
ncbi:beta-ketoacyl reductase [Aspergillus fijiensis CBS 313.89]|uniref:Carrier domain-containing protein n=1 Tax=Aspergillus fijiensis CBS 313.89 TaxID=1448319 RepID=A0A8G1RFS7_9EURO|nr:uncharacterized protein BO72DRAFT_505202 [Aspergillus fijiensis CBS 313.89]RAK71005.1 hypothetical protein BO72DRAFT_505202 [Aspergillus fijiensis CBS 313.89]